MFARWLIAGVLAFGAAQAGVAAPPAVSAEAAPGELTAAAANDLAALIGPEAPPPEQIRAGLDAIFARFAAERPKLAKAMPAALAQAAHLARTAEHPATRAAMGDLAREALEAAIVAAGMDPAADPVASAWAKADPGVREMDKLHLTRADDDAFRRIAAKAGYSGTFDVAGFWDESAPKQGNRMLPARMNAWAAGVEAAWPKLDPAERTRVVEVLDRKDVPSTKLLKKVIGTGDIVGWLTATDMTLTKAERAASPDLVGFMDKGAFAGPLAPTLVARAAASRGGGGVGIGGAATQLMRLNNWSAMTGEMSSWESYRYMTQGY